MKVVAVYNMKGGVGKTTTAVNLSFVAATGGQRVLLWDLDPQAAATFAFRIRPRVEGFGKKSFASGEALSAAIKQTDHANLDLLPADFAYRKVDRMLERLGQPKRVVRSLLDTLGREYDVLFLDCPAGFTLLSEGVLAAADAIVVPTIPTVFSLRTITRLIKRADRAHSSAVLAAFFNMVDRRKALHRRACEWSTVYPDVFLAGQVPYASVVEQMAVRRMPLAAFAARDAATAAFAQIWMELQARSAQVSEFGGADQDRWARRLQAVESLMARLDAASSQDITAPSRAPVIDLRAHRWTQAAEDPDAAGATAPSIVHRFDTERGDLARRGLTVELHECQKSVMVVVAMASADAEAARAQAQIDRSWACEILAGTLSPLAALERRLGRPGPAALTAVRATIGDRPLHRVDSRRSGPQGTPGLEHEEIEAAARSSVSRAV